MDYEHEPYDEEDEDFGPSRSQLKREAEAVTDLGRELVELSAERLKQVPLSEELLEAVQLARRIDSHGARKRQIQRIGKLLRQADLEPVREALDRFNNTSAIAIAEHHAAERWRERLLAEGDSAAGEFLDLCPGADRQKLRQLIRASQQEQAAGKPPKSYRELFRLVRDALADAES
jgi:ribosome-associated protein